jgi:23S rRNA (cytosine1962-C5)-methyltransferase
VHTPVLQVSLSPKGIRPVRNGHPWIYNNAIVGRPEESVQGKPWAPRFAGPGALAWIHTRPILVCDPSGVPIGWGTYNRTSRLAIRMLTRDVENPWTVDELTSVVHAAVRRRDVLWADPRSTAFRLVFGEADGVPGLVVDRYGDVLAVEYSSAFAWDNRETIEAALEEAVSGAVAAGTGGEGLATAIRIVRGWDERLAEREGISLPAPSAEDSGVGPGSLDPSAAGEGISVRENGLSWRVHPGSGQKTGLFCDQRDNRRAVAELSRGRRVLDAFSYHGGFGLTALAAGAREVCCIDSSADALAMVAENAREQGVLPGATPVGSDALQTVQGDFFEMARRRDGEPGGVPGGLDHWDVVVLDPPKLVPGRRHLEAGLRAYKDLNLSVMRGMRPGALLVTFSCSGAVSRGDFQRVLAWAAADAGRSVRILATLGQPADHPVPLSFPEAEYLTGFVLMVE